MSHYFRLVPRALDAHDVLMGGNDSCHEKHERAFKMLRRCWY